MEKEDRKSRKSRLRRNELLVWLGILTLVFIFSFILIRQYNKSFETHTIYMPDVYGLIQGSPVNIMGVCVGYVLSTKIVGEETIKVDFKITDRTVHLPKGTLATVEIYGLGGSKSLELYPPNSGKIINQELLVGGNDYFLVERPKRLRDCWTLLFYMYKTLMNIIYAVSNFGGELKDTETISPVGSYNDSVQLINYSNNWIDNSAKTMNNFRSVLESFHKSK